MNIWIVLGLVLCAFFMGVWTGSNFAGNLDRYGRRKP